MLNSDFLKKIKKKNKKKKKKKKLNFVTLNIKINCRRNIEIEL